MTSKPFSEINNTTYKLSIQIHLNGFSFCIVSNEGKIITLFETTIETSNVNENDLLEELKKVFKTKPELQASFEHIELIYQNELFSFVPQSLFDEDRKKDYLKYSIKTLATDFIEHDILPSNIVNVYIPYININNYILEAFGEFSYQHSSGLIVNHALQQNNNSENVFIYINNNQFDICIAKEQKLLLFNSFIKSNNEDVLYYLLFCMEQLELSPEKTPLKLLSPVDNSLFDLLYTYVRTVEKLEQNQNNLLHKSALKIN